MDTWICRSEAIHCFGGEGPSSDKAAQVPEGTSKTKKKKGLEEGGCHFGGQ